MKDFFAFRVVGRPVPQGAMRPVVAGGRLRAIHKEGKRLRAWRDSVTWEAVRARGARSIPFPKPIAVSLYLRFLLPGPIRPKAAEPVSRPDLQHLVRAVEDALTGILYDDDSQIVFLDAAKQYAVTSGQIGVTIVVWQCLDRITGEKEHDTKST